MEKIINPSLNNWVNNNRQLLLKYKGKWVAFNKDGLIHSAPDLKQLRSTIQKEIKKYAVYYVHPQIFGKITFRPIHFRSVFFHEWTPYYLVELSFHKQKIEIPMLIDSGADGSLIDYQTGIDLGLNVADGELQHEAQGIGGGKITYVWRSIQIAIEGNVIIAPVAWIISGEKQENIIGRQVVFDAWDIEFRQADEQIAFRFRGQPKFTDL
jgi:Aspartyl protease/Family of unknown function (DUF5678)